MKKQTKSLVDFLNGAHSVYHAVAQLVASLEEAGYSKLPEKGKWSLTAGGKYYLTRGDSALIAFRVPQAAPEGFMITASHSDRPTFKVKENGELTGKYTRLATEKYGGMLIAPWLDRPLSIAGRVLVETPTGAQSRLIDIDRDLLLIPNVAIHMNRKANEGYEWNPAVDTLPLVGSQNAQGKLWDLVEAEAGGKILGHDLYLYVRQNATVWGVDEEFISAAALDDLACAWCCAQGFMTATENKAIPVLCVFDSEEVGSVSAQGASSRFLEGTLSRICKVLALDEDQMLTGSFMLSADNAHALHPNHPEYADANNAPVLGGGVVLKFNANLRYATDGVTAAMFRKVCEQAGAQVQTYYNRADLPGGSTLGSVSIAHVSVPTADIGLPQLAMHSCYETMGVSDALDMENVMRVYYSSVLQTDGEGSFKMQ